MIKDAGFSDVIAEDRSHQVFVMLIVTSVRYDRTIFIQLCGLSYKLFLQYVCLQFMSVLQKELEGVEKEREEFINDFSEVRSLICYYIP